MDQARGKGDTDTSPPGRPRLRLVLADDHHSVREELGALLDREFDRIRTVGDGRALLEACAQLHPDVVVTDIQMPLLGGIEAGRQILQEGYCGSVILLSLHLDETIVRAAMSGGIRGYILKLDAGEELLNAVRVVAAGGTYLSAGVRARLS